MSQSKRYFVRDGIVLLPACYFKVSEHGFQIHFGEGIQPTTAFSREALEKEIQSLVEEDGYAAFTEVEFLKAKRAGLVEVA